MQEQPGRAQLIALRSRAESRAGSRGRALPPRQEHNEASVPAAALQRPPSWAGPRPPPLPFHLTYRE